MSALSLNFICTNISINVNLCYWQKKKSILITFTSRCREATLGPFIFQPREEIAAASGLMCKLQPDQYISRINNNNNNNYINPQRQILTESTGFMWDIRNGISLQMYFFYNTISISPELKPEGGTWRLKQSAARKFSKIRLCVKKKMKREEKVSKQRHTKAPWQHRATAGRMDPSLLHFFKSLNSPWLCLK